MPKPIKKQRWSNIDAFGLIKGLGIWDPQYTKLQYVRRPFDSSLNIRDKIHRLNDNAPALTKQGLLNGLCNEFGYDPYNVTERKSFFLTYNPVPSGGVGVQDISVKYRQVGSSGAWLSINPQVWGEGYEEAKAKKEGFIVWPEANFSNVSGIKNFNYSRNLEILQELDDNQEIQVIYTVSYIDEDNERQLISFTDCDNLNDPNDQRFLYRNFETIDICSGITVYKLADIPENLQDKYFNEEGHATEQIYKIKQYFQKQYKFTWDVIKNNSSIWDLQEMYCSGEIPNFYDAWIPKNNNHCIFEAISGSLIGYPTFFSGYHGGVNYLSNSLYLADLVEMDTAAQEWYLKIYPGSFYIDGIPYRLFEDPVLTGIMFVSGVADLPSGLERGMYTILAREGYYTDESGNFSGCVEADPYLSGFVFEDYQAPTGKNGDSEWSDIYRRRPNLTEALGYNIDLDLGEYKIDFDSRKIYLNSIWSSGTLVWDKALLTSGRVVQVDVNPLNQQFLNLQKFFLYLVNKE